MRVDVLVVATAIEEVQRAAPSTLENDKQNEQTDIQSIFPMNQRENRREMIKISTKLTWRLRPGSGAQGSGARGDVLQQVHLGIAPAGVTLLRRL
jgi:hypothetical protein